MKVRERTVKQGAEVMLHTRPGYAHVERGGLLGSEGRYQEAITEYDHAIAVDPDYLDAYNDRGLTYSKLGRYHQAIADFGHAIALGAGLTVYGRRGAAYLALGEYRRAIADFDQFIKRGDERGLTSMVGSALIGRGRAYMGIRDYRRALADLSRAIELVGDSYLAQRAYYFRGQARAAQGKVREALADYDHALAMTPRFDDTDTQRQHEEIIKDLRHRRDEVYRLATQQGTAIGNGTMSGQPARGSSWLGRLLRRRVKG